MSIIAILVPIVVLVILIWKRVNICVSALICTCLLAGLSGLNVSESISVDFMAAAGNYVRMYWPMFFLGASFGKSMSLGGGAADFAHMLTKKMGTKYTVPMLCVVAMILGYGGVNCFVIVFVVYPICLNIFKTADLPRKLVPGIISVGAFTAPSIGPGAPAIVNIMPTQYLGTTVTVLPLYSIILSVVYFTLPLIYMMWEEKRCRKVGLGFDADEATLKLMAEQATKEYGNGMIAIIPMAIVVVPLFFGVDVLVTLLVGWISVGVLYWKKIPNKLDLFNCGVADGMGALMATASVVGFGSVGRLTVGFTTLMDFATGMGGNPLVSYATGIGLLSAICASGTGGLALAMETILPRFMDMGIHPGVLHKVASIAAITTCSLPHNGVMVTMLAFCGLTHKEGYKDLFIINVGCTFVTLVVAIVLGSIMYPIGAW